MAGYKAIGRNRYGDFIDLGSWGTQAEAELAVAIYNDFSLKFAVGLTPRKKAAAEYWRRKAMERYRAGVKNTDGFSGTC